MESRKINSEEGKEEEVQIWVRVRQAKKAAASSESVPGGGTLGMAGAVAGFDVGSFSGPAPASGCILP